MKKRNKGFTLMEIMIAVAIVAIMIAAITPMIMKYTANAKLRQAETDLNTVATAMVAYISDNPDETMDVAFANIYTDGYIDKDPGAQGITYAAGILTKTIEGIGTVEKKIK